MNILTFDIEAWFLSGNNKKNPPETWHRFESRVEGNTARILKLLDTKDVKATFFILGWIAEHHPAVIRQIAENGHEIGYHTFYHQRLTEFTPVSFKEDVLKGVGLIEDMTGKKVRAFRAPYFSFTGKEEWFYDTLIELGFTVSSSVKSGVKFHGHIVDAGPYKWSTPGGSIVEFPLCNIGRPFTKTLFPGSGYFRVLPFRVIKRLLKNHDYLMFYFHPRDVDDQIPISHRLSPMRNIKNLAGAKTGLHKLSALLDSFDFFSIEKSMQFFQENNNQVLIPEWADKSLQINPEYK